ncbi:MAG: DNA-directed RNA polymerase subunit omega [Firmicutes bacterium]|jgi:DNA-directed RNA polymerase subunit omega|nr:DNA-directed RNA polymerase subunit omega [Bacillota bacterium]
MIYPSVDSLVEKVDSKYTLAITAAKRARQIREGSRPQVKTSSLKEVSIALAEIADDKIMYERVRDGIK